MLHHPQADRTDTSTLKICVSGGALMPAEVMRAFEDKFGCQILEGYGALGDLAGCLRQTAGTARASRAKDGPKTAAEVAASWMAAGSQHRVRAGREPAQHDQGRAGGHDRRLQ
jgi:acyl-CoA synthetase (AMP-forming)/AMP-acid ligase II